MAGQIVYIVCAEGEEPLAEGLAEPLRQAGYDVAHDGTVAVGDSLVGTAAAALASGAPIVLCATRKSAGSEWSHHIVNAGRANSRVFVVLMERQAYVGHLALDTKVARYCDDPATGMSDLVAALGRHFPPGIVLPAAAQAPAQRELQFLDQCSDAQLDHSALQRFRDTMRDEIIARHPAALTPREFLERGELVLEGRLTRTAALLFGERPAKACPTAMVKCVRYFGRSRADKREAETFEGPISEQIIAARDFVAKRVRRGERPSNDRAQSVPVYDYPMIAVREIIANALVHRDYSVDHACVHVRLFDDRLEISSPGSWLGREVPVGVSLDLATLVGHSIKRNFRLAHVLSWVRLVEGEGSGIPTVLSECDGTDVPAPTVLQEQGFVTVTLRPLSPSRVELVSRIGRTDMPVPMQLPLGVSQFIGRRQELDELRSHVVAQTLIVITGMAGVGKTALAVHFAHQIAEQFPDGQLYADLNRHEPHTSAGEALTGFLEALGVPHDRIPGNTDARAALYRSLLANRRMLIVVDGAREADEIAPLLPGTPGSLVIAVSRSHLVEATLNWGAATVSLDVSPIDDALTLLGTRAGHERVNREPEAAREVVELCGALPLAISIAGARAAYRPALSLAELVGELRTVQSFSDETPLRAAFDHAYQRLSTGAKSVYRALGVHPGPDVDIAAVSAIAGVSRREAGAAAAELTRSSLLEESRVDRYRLHPLLRQHARELLSKNEFNAALQRMSDHYAENGVDGDVDVLPEIFSEARRAGLDEQVCGLAFVLTPMLESQHRWDEVVEVQTAAREAAARLGDHLTEARSMARAATALEELGRAEKALTLRRRSADIAQKIINATKPPVPQSRAPHSARAAEQPAGASGGRPASADRETAARERHQHGGRAETATMGLLSDLADLADAELLGIPDADGKPTGPPQADPPLTPQCCGPPRPFFSMVSDGPVEHEPDCPNHPDNLANEDVVS